MVYLLKMVIFHGELLNNQMWYLNHPLQDVARFLHLILIFRRFFWGSKREGPPAGTHLLLIF